MPASRSAFRQRDGFLRGSSRGGRRTVEHLPSSAIVMNDGEALVVACAAGPGALQVPDDMVTEAFRDGRLVEVLAPYRPPPVPVSLVYASNRGISLRLRALIEVLISRY